MTRAGWTPSLPACWSMCAPAAPPIRPNWPRRWDARRHATTGAGSRTPPRVRSICCIVSVICAWLGGGPASACSPPRRSRPRRTTRRSGCAVWCCCWPACLHRCRRPPCRAWSRGWSARCSARRHGQRQSSNCCTPGRWKPPRSTASATSGRPTTAPPPEARARWSASWRRLIRWYGTVAALSICGAGPIGSRPTRRPPSACAATTPCRCYGAMR